MDIVREQLLYKENKVHVCMSTLAKIEQYELIRLLLATRTKEVYICTHESTNDYINSLLKKLSISFYQCFSPTEIQVEDNTCQDARLLAKDLALQAQE
jgi:hypothetical protein